MTYVKPIFIFAGGAGSMLLVLWLLGSFGQNEPRSIPVEAPATREDSAPVATRELQHRNEPIDSRVELAPRLSAADISRSREIPIEQAPNEIREFVDAIERFVVTSLIAIPNVEYDGAELARLERMQSDLSTRLPPEFRNGMAFGFAKDAHLQCYMMTTAIRQFVSSNGPATLSQHFPKPKTTELLSKEEKKAWEVLDRVMDRAEKCKDQIAASRKALSPQ